ncbi:MULTISPECIES: hypothetical protein [Aneurinibacillus]|jgi:hypothetical protein|uniref:Uncharacterized protein n=1 Tax=Aneurinibacillus danicus TaxID=267746 RepID=A0A511VBK9_9BACL|nr:MULTISPECIES: hypothetical protein [Aneurinibacillus]GEN36307.1 hypothetical protein ADA01nite_37670 [Aneurinibacillus danicus]
MDEKYILAYFNTPEQAENIRQQLAAQEGIIALQVDRIGLYPGPEPERPINSITGNFASLASLTTDASPGQIDANIMMAAHPSASGMSDGDDDTIRGRDILLTVVMRPEYYESVRKMIRSAGGLI